MFDSPIELLETCHEKVLRFTNLMLKLEIHVSKRGADARAREAAQSILRYFTIAAPLHHQDEEEDLFPALRLLNPESIGLQHFHTLISSIERLEREHQTLEKLWAISRVWLEKIEQGENSPAPNILKEYVAMYQNHVAQEEAEIYPHTALLAQETLQSLVHKMTQRRRLVKD